MIGRLKGRIEAVGESFVVLDVHGVGYEVQCSARTLRTLEPGRDVALTIDTHVREDAIRLYGFQSETERAWFRQLQTVQGVGAKAALSVLGVLGPQELANAVALSNWAAIEQAPGIGRRLAQRIAAEMKGKAPATALATAGSAADAGGPPPATAGSGSAVEAVSAIVNLGYTPAQAGAAVAAALRELGADADTAKLIRRGLRELAR